ncbi:MAG: AAA family ATPase [Leptospirales bacterium]
MVIKELEILGFKSFASKTKIDFNTSFTSIVGPNGCGKSNILDAVKWVMGEKSVRAMRGDKMEDVIFSGTEEKKPSGYAYVHLVIDNKDKLLPLEIDEVKIARKLYRDGQSQYFINDNRITRKELETLLMDTGLGKASYSFMQQGQMDMILSSKPEDRRLIFEEAAGITRFKSQREEAEKKLENTASNMTRLKDIIHELERELTIKKNQSERTKQYNKLNDKQLEFDLNIRYATIKDINDTLVKFNEKLSKKTHEREKSRQKIILWEEKAEELNSEKEKLSHDLHEKDIHNQVSGEKIIQWKREISELENRKKTVEDDMSSLNERMDKIRERISDLKKSQNNYQQLHLQLDNQLENAESSIDTLNQNILDQNKAIEDRTNTRAEIREEVAQKHKLLKESRTEYEIIVRDLLVFLKEEKENWSGYLSAMDQKSSSFESEIQTFSVAFQNLINNASGDATQVSSAMKDLSGLLKTSEWIDRIREYGKLEHDFWDNLFEKGGVHARKEAMDERIFALDRDIDNGNLNIGKISSQLESMKEELAYMGSQKDSIQGDIKSYEVKKTSIHEQEKQLQQQMEHEETQLNYFTNKFKGLESELLQLTKLEKDITIEIEKTHKNIEKEIQRINSIKENLERIEEKKKNFQSQIYNENSKTTEYLTTSSELEVKIGTLLGSKESLLQDIYNDYNLLPDDLAEKFQSKNIDISKQKGLFNEIKSQIRDLGPINPLATEEWQTINSLYEHNKNQLNDILEAKQKIESVIGEIIEKSEKMFTESFEKIQANFKSVFNTLFRGGDVQLNLINPEVPLRSGIEIQVQPPGKRPRSLKLLSGGEKALTAIALMFGIYMVRSSPICILDEIDAPLDDQNVARFLHLLEGFRKQTQFILITHNKKTMTKSDSIFGVTMDDPGVSKLLSVQIKGEE